MGVCRQRLTPETLGAFEAWQLGIRSNVSPPSDSSSLTTLCLRATHPLHPFYFLYFSLSKILICLLINYWLTPNSAPCVSSSKAWM